MREHTHRRITRHRSIAAVPDRLDDARNDIRFIRSTLERSTSFTGVSGAGTVAVGVSALFATLISSFQTSAAAWLAVWGAEFLVALAITALTMAKKAGGFETMVHSPAARRCALCLLPAAVSGLVLTALVLRLHWVDLAAAQVPGWLPGIWILLYGVAVFTGGTVSLPIIRAMGACFAGFGTLVCLAPFSAALATAVAFGGFHILFGALIARKEKEKP